MHTCVVALTMLLPASHAYNLYTIKGFNKFNSFPQFLSFDDVCVTDHFGICRQNAWGQLLNKTVRSRSLKSKLHNWINRIWELMQWWMSPQRSLILTLVLKAWSGVWNSFLKSNDVRSLEHYCWFFLAWSCTYWSRWETEERWATSKKQKYQAEV